MSGLSATRFAALLLGSLSFAALAAAEAGFDESLCLLSVTAKVKSAHPIEYYERLDVSTKEEVRKMRRVLLGSPCTKDKHKHSKKIHVEVACGSQCGYATDGSQRMWFTNSKCSVASADITYVATHTVIQGEIITAKKGEIVAMNCEDVQCPVPVRRNCYANPDICGEHEWCMIKEHEKYGDWAVGPTTDTENPQYPGSPIYGLTYSKDMCEAMESRMDSNAAVRESYRIHCPGNATFPELARPFRPVTGRCVKYRQEQQSCISVPGFWGAQETDKFLVQPNGKPFERPLVCARNLTCTGPGYSVLPSTCVPKRPKDICYMGPWWDSSDCPRTQKQAPAQSGLTYEQLVNASMNFLLLYPGEISSAGDCGFWQANTTLGNAVYETRMRGLNILKQLWPYKVYPAGPPKDILERLDQCCNPLPRCTSSTPEYCDPGNCSNPNGTEKLANGHLMANRPNKIWSLAHFVTMNLPDPVPASVAQASQALAVFLAHSFWCDDCKGFFQVGVIEEYGLPPITNQADDIAKWWWNGHNVAGEHVATTRAGHPWIHELGEADAKAYQNPWYMTWEDAQAMWVMGVV